MWVIGIPVALVFTYVVYVFFNMIFISQITSIKKNFDVAFEVKLEGIKIEETSDNENVIEYELKPEAGDIEGSKVIVLTSEGLVEDSRRFFDADPGREVEIVVRENNLKSLVFNKNDVYEVGEGKLKNKIGSYSDPKLSFVRHVMPINENIMLVSGDRADARYADPWLWQVDLRTFKKIVLTKDPYYSHDRPPKAFVNKHISEKIVIYYTGDYSFGFGGYSSRPKKSVVRIYNRQFPEGKDIASFAFKAGTIVNVEWNEKNIVLTGDPSKPGGSIKNRVPARKWEITFIQDNT